MRFSLEDAQALEREAEQNDGHCSHCGNTIKIYKYKANRALATMLKLMADVVKDTGINKVHYDNIPVAHALHSQRAKLRQHGLIAKYKEDGKHVANMWVITRKGWDWLKGEPIPKKVIVYNNQVLGHEDGLITIGEALGEKYDPQVYAEVALAEPEAKAVAHIREPQKTLVYDAQYLGYPSQNLNNNDTYEIEIERMQIGRPVKIIRPIETEYRTVADFLKKWKIIKTEG